MTDYMGGERVTVGVTPEPLEPTARSTEAEREARPSGCAAKGSTPSRATSASATGSPTILAAHDPEALGEGEHASSPTGSPAG